MKKVSLRHEQTIFPSTILEFTWLIIDGFMGENSLAPSLKRVTPNTESPKKFEIFSASTTWYSPITIGIIFLVWIHIHYSLYVQGVFKSNLKKITPTQIANSHLKSQFELSPCYINLMKNVSPPAPLPSPRGHVNYEIPLDMSMYIFNCSKPAEAVILIYL